MVWDGTTATITVDIEEPLDLNEQPVWPAHERDKPALYVRRVVVNRRYADLGLGAALLDWAAHVAKRITRPRLSASMCGLPIRSSTPTTKDSALRAARAGIRENLPTTRHKRSSSVR